MDAILDWLKDFGRNKGGQRMESFKWISTRKMDLVIVTNVGNSMKEL
jgi:hypothetical protein